LIVAKFWLLDVQYIQPPAPSTAMPRTEPSPDRMVVPGASPPFVTRMRAPDQAASTQ
jgi:hypothetical protein